MEKHADHFDVIIKGSMPELTAAFRAVVVEISKDSGSGHDLALDMLMAKVASDLQRSVDRFTHNNLQSTWSRFDKNNDGFLQKEEMREVVKSLLKEIHKNLPQMVNNAMEPTEQNLEQWISSDTVGALGFHHNDGGSTIALHLSVQKRMEKAQEKLKLLLEALMMGMIGDSAAISDDLFDTIDVYKDGKVSAQEYSDGFAKAFGDVVDFNKITKLLLQTHSSSKRGSKSDVDNMTEAQARLQARLDNVTAVLIVAAVATAAFFAWKQKH